MLGSNGIEADRTAGGAYQVLYGLRLMILLLIRNVCAQWLIDPSILTPHSVGSAQKPIAILKLAH